jgi:hypothetical protein
MCIIVEYNKGMQFREIGKNSHKKFFLLVFFLFSVHIVLSAQESKRGPEYRRIGLTYASFGENDVIRFDDLVGAAEISGVSFYTIGVSFVHPINKWLESETGIEYSSHDILIHPNVPPDMDQTPQEESFSLINIPISFRANFLRFFFVNAGAIVDIDASTTHVIDNQAGIGALLGVAVKYDAPFGLSIFMNPYARYHSLIPFSQGSHHQRVYDSGIRVGMSYTFNRKPRSGQQ